MVYPWENLSEQFKACTDKHVIIDFETIGNAQKHPNCATPSMGILVFDPSELLDFDQLVNRALRIKLDYKAQIANGRVTDADTIAWWQSPDQAEARKHVIDYDGSEVSLERMALMINVYLERMGWTIQDVKNGGMFWSRGNAFDMPLLSNIYDSIGVEEPIPFWAIRDVRTHVDAITSIWDTSHYENGYVSGFPMPKNATKHIETHDIALDVMHMQYTQIKLIEFMEKLAGG